MSGCREDIRAKIQKIKEDTEDNKQTGKLFSLSDFDFAPKKLGHGRFGKVYLVKEKRHDLIMVIKVIDKTNLARSEMEQQMFYELFILSKLRHRNIVKLYNFFTENEKIHMIMEFAPNGSLYNRMQVEKYKRFCDADAAKYLYQIVNGLSYVHSNDYLHGDVKPENVLLDYGFTAKLADFGWSCPIGACRTRGICGTEDYMAPEIINQEHTDEKLDHWALGVTTFQLISGKLAFSGRVREIIRERIVTVDLKFPPTINEHAQDLISSLLTFDPKRRLKLSEVLRHKWIRNNYPAL